MSEFKPAIEALLQDEGGYVNDPEDQGGETKYGISKRWHPSLNISALTQSEASGIYEREWWTRYMYDQIEEQALASKVLNLAVNLGPHKAHTLLQEALADVGCEVACDGIIGAQTLAALNIRCKDPQKLLMAFKLRAIDNYLRLDLPRYLKGWIRRALR